MPLPKFQKSFGLGNPIKDSKFYQRLDSAGIAPPVGSEFLETESGDEILTEDGNNLVTE